MTLGGFVRIPLEGGASAELEPRLRHRADHVGMGLADGPDVIELDRAPVIHRLRVVVDDIAAELAQFDTPRPPGEEVEDLARALESLRRAVPGARAEDGTLVLARFTVDELPRRLYPENEDWPLLFGTFDVSPHVVHGAVLAELLADPPTARLIDMGSFFYIHELCIHPAVVHGPLPVHALRAVLARIGTVAPGVALADPTFVWEPVMGRRRMDPALIAGWLDGAGFGVPKTPSDPGGARIAYVGLEAPWLDEGTVQVLEERMGGGEAAPE